MYYKKMSNMEVQILRGGLDYIKNHCLKTTGGEIPKKDDAVYKEYQTVCKLEKKLVHVYYLSRKWQIVWHIKPSL